MNIFLTGASGFIGSHIRKALQRSGHNVFVARRSQGLDYSKMCHSKDWFPYLENIDVVVNCVGIISENKSQNFDTVHHLAPKALFEACVLRKIKKVVHISALGADDSAKSPYHLSKKAGDIALQKTSLDWYILRPSLVYGERGKSYRFFKLLARLPIIPLIDEGKQWVQPVSIDDLTATVLRCLKVKQSQIVLEVLGKNCLLFKNFLALLALSQGRPDPVYISIPFGLAWRACHLLQFISPLFNPDNIQMLKQGSCGDVNLLADFLGYMPQDIKEVV